METTPFEELTRKTLRYIDVCAHAALKSDFNSSKCLGACINLNGTILSAANVKKQNGKINSLHAEINVLLQYTRRCKQQRRASITVYVVRLLNDTSGPRFGYCKPCEFCQPLLISANVKTIFYTDSVNNKNVLCKLKLR